MRTISAPFAETGDIFKDICPKFSTSPQVGDSIVIYCRKTRQYYDGEVMGADWYAYTVLVGEKRSGRFKRKARKQQKVPRLGTLRGLSNIARGEETRRQIMELLKGNGKMSSAEIAARLGMSRTAISLHLRKQLASQVRRTRSRDNSAIWEAIMDKGEKPKGLFICLACERAWKGEQLFLDPQAIGGNWTCGDLTCGGSVLAVDEHEWSQYCEAEVKAGNLKESPPPSGKPVTEEIPF